MLYSDNNKKSLDGVDFIGNTIINKRSNLLIFVLATSCAVKLSETALLNSASTYVSDCTMWYQHHSNYYWWKNQKMICGLSCIFHVNTVITPLALTDHVNSIYKWLCYVRSCGQLWSLFLLMPFTSDILKLNLSHPN